MSDEQLRSERSDSAAKSITFNQAELGEELVTGATYRYVPQPIEITDEIVDRAFEAGAVWFREHPDGASSDEDWRDFHRTVLMAAELRG